MSHTSGHVMQVNTIKEDEVVRIETQDWTGGQIKDDDSAEDMKNIDLSLVCLHAYVHGQCTAKHCCQHAVSALLLLGRTVGSWIMLTCTFWLGVSVELHADMCCWVHSVQHLCPD